MMIRFIPSMKHYGKNALTMSNEELDITSASQKDAIAVVINSRK